MPTRRADRPFRPTREQLLAAVGKTIPDLIEPGLNVLFCGINPGLYSAAIRHHFGRPGNRFWPTLHAAGFTPRRLSPFEERGAAHLRLRHHQFRRPRHRRRGRTDGRRACPGRRPPRAEGPAIRPEGVGRARRGRYRTGFAKHAAKLGPQPALIGKTEVWVLPNPSGLNAHYQGEALARLFRELKDHVG